MNKVRNWFNYQEKRLPTPETANLPSLTVPDQTLSLKELIQRHASGREVTALVGSYQETGDYDHLLAHIEGMSEIDRIEYSRKLKKEVREGLAAYQADTENRQKRQEEAKAAAIAAQLAASEEARTKPEPPAPPSPKKGKT